MTYNAENLKSFGDHNRNDTQLQENKDKQQQLDMKDIQLPYSSCAWATLIASFPLDQASWDQMIAILQAMKPGLVKENKPEETDFQIGS